jgi:DNA invertase Pin-like site-specific DNA recombinase
MADRAGRWFRVSGDSQSEEDQEPDINGYIDDRGYIKGPIFRVHGKSAFKGAQDPDWQKVIAAFQRGEIDVVVCWMVDRLDRQNILHAIPMVLAVLDPKVGGRIEFSEQPECNLDAASPDIDDQVKAFSDRIHAAVQESKIKSKRVNKAFRKRRDIGSVTGRAAWGFTIYCTVCGRESSGKPCRDHKKIFKPTAEGRKYIPLIFQAIIDGKTLRQVCEWLDAEGVKTQYGKPWNEAFLGNRLIRNTTYYGTRPNGGNLETEALVSAQVWQEAQAALKARYRGGRSTVTHPKALLHGLCGACFGQVRQGCPDGRSPLQRIFVGKAPNRMAYYRCTGHGPQRKGCGAKMIPVKDLDEAVIQAITSDDSQHEEYEFIPGDDRSEEIARLRERGAAAMRQGDYRAATEAMRQAEQLEALPRVAPHWERQITDISEGDYFLGLDPADWREYIAKRYEVIGEMTDRGATAGLVARELTA